MARSAKGSIEDTACAARVALLRIYNARSNRDRERAHTAADGPLRDAEAAGLITNAQRQALHLDPMDEGTPALRPDEKLRPPLQEIKDALEAFAEAASTCLEDTSLPGT